MQRNKLKDIWASGNPVLVGWCSIGNPFTAEIMAAQGYDAINIDAQHGALGLFRAPSHAAGGACVGRRAHGARSLARTGG